MASVLVNPVYGTRPWIGIGKISWGCVEWAECAGDTWDLHPVREEGIRILPPWSAPRRISIWPAPTRAATPESCRPQNSPQHKGSQRHPGCWCRMMLNCRNSHMRRCPRYTPQHPACGAQCLYLFRASNGLMHRYRRIMVRLRQQYYL
jgi:hypothetical protein